MFGPIITNNYKDSVTTDIFTKVAEVILTYKKNMSIDKSRFRPVSIFPNFINVCERRTYKFIIFY